MGKRHHFIESDARYTYERVIYCTACGMVVWHWNQTKNEKYQDKVGTPCIEAKPTNSKGENNG